MAVQAQYPSNILLLNRNGQEGKNGTVVMGNDYNSMLQQQQQQQGGGFLDQSSNPIFFGNGVGANSRKRSRDVVGNGNGGGGGSSAGAVPINWFSVQPPQPTLINLSQLHNHHHHQQQQGNGVSTGLRLSFGDQQQQQQNHQSHQNHHHQQQQQQNIVLPSSLILSSCSSPSSSSILSDDLTLQIKQQRDEIDQFLQAQGDHLRRTLAERRQAHYRALLCAAEGSLARRLRDKEMEVEKAARRSAELEDRVAQHRAEAQAWQSKARAHEATAAGLQAQLQQAMACAGPGGVGAQDKIQECEAEDAESAHVDPVRVDRLDRDGSSSVGPACRLCRTRAASVVLLPCRHLSLCTACNAVSDTCPRCATRRTTSVEVFLP
ncbi:hypothetical protein Sjap_004684 [Stephania japonica]|uniref:RING-type domain-containing protein n=1 Tax=Stephania japonica TaxID=461633 RepID=A0AAP0K2N3_9MAGN